MRPPANRSIRLVRPNGGGAGLVNDPARIDLMRFVDTGLATKDAC